MTWTEFTGEMLAAVALVVGALTPMVINAVSKWLRDRYAIDDVVDVEVERAAAVQVSPTPGAVKRKVVNALRDRGVPIGERIAVSLFGRIGRSAKKSILRRIKK